MAKTRENFKRLAFRQSALNTLNFCPHKYRLQFIDCIEVPSKPATVIGIAFHRACEKVYHYKFERGEMPPLELATDAFADELTRHKDTTEWNGTAGCFSYSKDVGVRCVKAHWEKIAPTVAPLLVEKKFTIALPTEPFDIEGTVDLVEENHVVVDNKTSSRAFGSEQKSISRQIQPTMYCYAIERLTGQRPKGFRFDVVVKPNGVKLPATVQQISGNIEMGDYQHLFGFMRRAAAYVMERIKTGKEFEKVGSHPWCSEKVCVFWFMCKGAKNGR